MLLLPVPVATAACNLQITSAGPCLADATYATPKEGDAGFYYSYAFDYYLQPLGVLTVTNTAAGLFQFGLSNAPEAGTVVLEGSTNLLTWAPIVTNTANADGSSLNYSFPTANPPHRFFQALQVP